MLGNIKYRKQIIGGVSLLLLSISILLTAQTVDASHTNVPVNKYCKNADDCDQLIYMYYNVKATVNYIDDVCGIKAESTKYYDKKLDKWFYYKSNIQYNLSNAIDEYENGDRNKAWKWMLWAVDQANRLEEVAIGTPHSKICLL